VEPEVAEPEEEPAEASAPQETQAARPQGQPSAPEGDGQGGRRRRRRRRRGGRGRNGQPHPFHDGQQQRPQEPQHVEAAPQSDDDDGASEETEETAPAIAAASQEPGRTEGSSAPHQEGGGRRRRRRRGRRGRRPDGDPSNGAHRQPQTHGEYQSAAAGQPRHETHIPNPQPEAVEPNAPSSPQWSLSEQRSETRVVERDPEPSTPREEFAPSRHPEPATAEAVEPEASEPRETRKGWWQRRFKI